MVIAAQFVIAGLTRNPVVAQHWIPDQSLPRARSGVRNDVYYASNSSRRVKACRTVAARTAARSPSKWHFSVRI